MDPDLLRFWTAGTPAVAAFPGVAVDPLAGERDGGAPAAGPGYGDVPKLEQIRIDLSHARRVREGEKLSKLWNDLRDLGMLKSNDRSQWFIDPTAAPTAAAGVTGTFP